MFRLKAKSSMLIGQPCRTEHWIGIGPVVCPLMWIDKCAWLYIFSMRATNFVLKPYFDSNLKILMGDPVESFCEIQIEDA